MGLGDKLNDLKNEHGDKANDEIDNAQKQHSDKLGDNADKVNNAVDGAQEKFLGGDNNDKK
ncbi:MAG: Rv0909 family putative TA system antitoxin [Micrococcaceae bacterium]